MKPIIILYHANCLDGFTSAWCAWKKLKDSATYIPVKHQVPPPKVFKNKVLYLLDFSYKEKIMRELELNNKKITILDHHASAKDDMESLGSSISKSGGRIDLRFDCEHSGAYLSWKYFHPKKKIPRIVLYVQDNDLWHFKKPKTREIVSFMGTREFDFKEWNILSRKFEKADTRRECIKQGELIQQYEKKIIKDIASSAITVSFEGYNVLSANCPILRSEIGHNLVDKKGPFSIIWREKGGQVVVSLRANGKVNVAKIAEKYGGGGHPSASGFTLKRGVELPWTSLRSGMDI